MNIINFNFFVKTLSFLVKFLVEGSSSNKNKINFWFLCFVVGKKDWGLIKCLGSSVGRAGDWKSPCHRFKSGPGHHLEAKKLFCFSSFFRFAFHFRISNKKALRAKILIYGWVVEWSMALVLKTNVAWATKGSNPFPPFFSIS